MYINILESPKDIPMSSEDSEVDSLKSLEFSDSRSDEISD